MRTSNGHETRRRATHEALRIAALARFQRDGFDATAVADIAADAGVTERTFYRHFPTKEAVLFQDYDLRLDWLARALSVRPPGEDIFDSVLAATASYPDDIEIVRQTALMRGSLISRETAQDYLRLVQASFADVIAQHASSRMGNAEDADLLAHVAGATIAAALVAAVDVWGARGATDDLGELVVTAVTFARSGLSLAASR